MPHAPQKKRTFLMFLAFLVAVLLVSIVLVQPTEASPLPCCGVVRPPYPAGTQWNQIYQPNTGTTGGGQNIIQYLNSYPSTGLMTVYQVSQTSLFSDGSAWAETKAGFTLHAGPFTTGTHTFTYEFNIFFDVSLDAPCTGFGDTRTASATVEFKGNMVDAKTGSALLYPDLITTVFSQSLTCVSQQWTQGTTASLQFTVNLHANHPYLWVLYLDVQTRTSNTAGLSSGSKVDLSASPAGAYSTSVSW